MNESVPIVSKIMMEVISLILGKTCLLVFFYFIYIYKYKVNLFRQMYMCKPHDALLKI